MQTELEKLQEEVARLNRSVHWYQQTYEKRKLIGIVKDRFFRILGMGGAGTQNPGQSGGQQSDVKHALETVNPEDKKGGKFPQIKSYSSEADAGKERVTERGKMHNSGKKTGEMSQEERDFFSIRKTLSYFQEGENKSGPSASGPEIDIVLPVYNGLDYLKILLPQIFLNSDLPFRLFIVNDCSPDKNVQVLLRSFQAKHKNIVLIENEKNLGFTHSVNKALRMTSNHVVLLNTDTEVPEKWLSRLVYPFSINPDIATCTPFSNCATICSFPQIGDNELFGTLSVSELDRIFQKGRSYSFEIPTGVGFCMAMSRVAIERIGLLDEDKFEKGYGEEVDWCQRAIKAGFKNVLVQNLFVYHKHGGSFASEEKNKLVANHTAIIDSLYPDFHPSVMDCVANSFHNRIREGVLLFACQADAAKTILYLDHDLGGGANLYLQNTVTDQKRENLVLVLKYNHPLSNPEKQYTLQLFYKEHTASYTLYSVSDLEKLLEHLKVDELVISEIVSYPEPLQHLQLLMKLRKRHRFRMQFLLHDYFSVCPNFVLMYQNKTFCNVPEMSGCEACVKMVNYNPVLFPTDYSNLVEWRKSWLRFLNETDSIVCFTPSAKHILLKAYPVINKTLISVIPHQVADLTRINVGVLGNIHSEFKGSSVLLQIAKTLETRKINQLKLHVIGSLAPEARHDRIKVLGPYEREDLLDILEKNKIHLIFIPSICPETFSYTTREAILSGLPVCSFNIGGQGDQVREYERGIILRELNADYVVDEFLLIGKELEQKHVKPVEESYL